MPLNVTRRRLIAIGAAAPALFAFPTAARAEPFLGEAALGDENAAVTVIEYASFTCPHCAAFHVESWPRFKAAYVDSGKVRFIFREVYFDRYGLWASMIARCGGEAGFFRLADQFLKRQADWTEAEDIPGALQKIGKLNGLSAAQLRDCLGDEDYAKSLVEIYRKNAEADDVNSTPTFIVNGEKHAGNIGFDALSELVEANL